MSGHTTIVRMEWLNYHHLYYFHMIAQEGGLAKAAVRLRLTHSTLSAQLRSLEQFLNQPLFDRKGRRLVLTPFGSDVAQYAADIFRLGGELVDVARGRSASRRVQLRVGAIGTLPKTIVYRLLEPALDAGPDVAVSVRQAPLEELLLHLAGNRVHLVLSDSPPPAGQSVRVHTHPLGTSGLLLYATPPLARKYRRGFPGSLADAPFVLPSAGTGLRGAMERWFADHGIRVQVAGEIDDAGLLRVFGALGRGIFPIRAVLQKEVEETHAVQLVGPMDGVTERYYAISPHRRTDSALVAAIIEGSRTRLAPFEKPPLRADARRKR
jgi:LysR family transcriptional regulator, transcriptional activator of nhaA